MRHILDSDNIVMSVLTRVGNLIILNFWFILGCVPIVTIGASLSATLSVAMKMNEGEERNIMGHYLKAFRKNFFQATGMWLLFLLAAIVIGGDIFYAVTYTAGGVKALIVGFSGFMAFLILMTFTFAFPIQSRYNNKVLKHIWNGFVLSVGNLLWTLLIWLIWVLPVATFYFYPWVFKYFGFVWFLLGFGCLFLLTAVIYQRIFRKINNME